MTAPNRCTPAIVRRYAPAPRGAAESSPPPIPARQTRRRNAVPASRVRIGSERPATSPHSTSAPRAATATMQPRPSPSIAPTWIRARRGNRPHTAHPATQAASTPISRGTTGASPCAIDATSITPIISPGNASRRSGPATRPDERGSANRRTSPWTRGRVAERRPLPRSLGDSATRNRGCPDQHRGRTERRPLSRA